jgi:hypothetical protein
MGRVEDRSDILSINLRDTKCLSGKNKLIYQEQQKVHENQVVAIVKQIQKENKNKFKGLDPSITAKAIIGMCNYACIWYKDNGSLSMDDVAEHFYKILTGN